MVAIVNAITTGSSTNGTSYASAAFTPALLDYLIVFVHASDTAADGTLTDSQGLGWDKLTGIVSNTDDRFVAFKSQTTAAASSMTVTWDCSADAATGALIAVMRVSGSDGNIRQVANASGLAAATPSVVFGVNCLTTSGVIFATANLSNPHGNTVPSGYNAQNGGAYSTPTTGVTTSRRNSGETSNAITAGGLSATDWTTIGIEIFNAGVGITHAATGALIGAGSTLSGSSQHQAKHTASGSLSGQGSNVTATASRYRSHSSSGILPGQSAVINCASLRYRQHNATGQLLGQGSLIAGSATRFRSHTASGNLPGESANITASADRTRLHQTSGVLPGTSAQLSGQSGHTSDTVDIKIPSSIEIKTDYLRQSITVDLSQQTISVSYEQQSIEASL